MKEKIIVSRFLTLSDNDPLEIEVEPDEIKNYKEASNLVNLNVNGGVIFKSPIKPKTPNKTPDMTSLNKKEKEEFREIWYGSYWNSRGK
jgi:hypothetical protein